MKTRISLARACVGLAICTLLGARPNVASADEPKPSNVAPESAAVRERAEFWTRELGSKFFARRERASREIAKLGLEAQEALEAAAAGKDAEVRRRAKKLLPTLRRFAFEDRLREFEIHGVGGDRLPGWRRFRDLVGESDATRRLFVALAKAEQSVLERLEKGGGDEPKDTLATRCQKLRSEGVGAEMEFRETNFAASVAALLLVASDPSVFVTAQTSDSLFYLAVEPAFSREAQEVVHSGAYRKLVEQWLERDFPQDVIASYSQFRLATAYDSPQGLRLSLRMAQANGAPPTLRYFGLFGLVKFGSAANLAAVEAHFQDASVHHQIAAPRKLRFEDLPPGAGPPRKGPARNEEPQEEESFDDLPEKIIQEQVRDAALAVAILLRGQDPKDFGFPFARRTQGKNFEAGTLGFIDDAQRALAFEKWRTWVLDHPLETESGAPPAAEPEETPTGPAAEPAPQE